MIKFGIMAMPQHPTSDSPVKRLRETVELTRVARDAGLDSISAGHHYLSPPYQNIQNVPLLARLAADSGDMQVILSVLLLPLFSPVQVAEDVASLDVITEGRLVFGIGVGYRDIEYEAFNVERRHRVPRFMESLDLVRRLWTEDQVTHDGAHFSLKEATCTIRPVQVPHPPIWIAANQDSVVKRAGRLGYAWFVNPHATLETLARQMDLYREGLAEGGKDMPEDMPLMKEMHVARTHDEAVDVAQPYLQGKYSAYADWGQHKALPGQDDFRAAFEFLARDRFIVGDVDEVIQQIEDHHHRLGANHFIFRIWWPGMEIHHAYRVVETMGEHIVPYFRKKYGAAAE